QTMKPVTALLPLLVFTLACEDAEPKKPLCDPSEANAGRVALEAQVGGNIGNGPAVMYDNGFPFVFVDGQCNYWSSGTRTWRETRTGVLDADTAAELGARLHFGAWPDLAGTWLESGYVDAPTLIFDDSTRVVVCASLCDGSSVPDSVKAMRDELFVVAQELWDRGSAVESGVRAIAIAYEPFQGIPFVDWPLARPISDFVRTGSVEPGQGVLEDDPASAQALKDLRASFVRGDHGAFGWDMLPVKSDGAYYQLYLRDTLPFEDAQGFVPLTSH
ncbi:MAG: hypothetical protein HOV81_41010, partial [Kofleriaceae bacterium]|nr:hypothetical protein [Kofleriaceae bacterium]